MRYHFSLVGLNCSSSFPNIKSMSYLNSTGPVDTLFLKEAMSCYLQRGLTWITRKAYKTLRLFDARVGIVCFSMSMLTPLLSSPLSSWPQGFFE